MKKALLVALLLGLLTPAIAEAGHKRSRSGFDVSVGYSQHNEWGSHRYSSHRGSEWVGVGFRYRWQEPRRYDRVRYYEPVRYREYCEPAPVYVAPRYCPPPVVYVPPPRVYYPAPARCEPTYSYPSHYSYRETNYYYER